MSEVMSDPILFWTLCAVIAANIVLLVVASINVINADREAGRFRSDGGQSGSPRLRPGANARTSR
jgi:hypothetical protein